MSGSFAHQGKLKKYLECELSILKSKFQMVHELKVKWLPDVKNKKSGEVLGKIIYIYDKDEAKVLDTLKYRFAASGSRMLASLANALRALTAPRIVLSR